MIVSPPVCVLRVLKRLTDSGFKAYLVGGCVRDSLLGKEPLDWDITTAALPEQVRSCFPDATVIDTGIAHGTVTVVMDGQPYEITTFRVDGSYTDHRRPDSVDFTPKLSHDLSRRDFTINAMAWSEDSGLVDCFGGIDDLNSSCIRCVGDAEKRFNEDALRVLRAVRFASVLGFEIEESTAKAVHNCAHLLKYVAPERIRAELDKFIMGSNVHEVLQQHSSVLLEIIPEFAPCVGLDQKNPHHHLDVWKHIILAVSQAEAILEVRLAALFHDIGKPQCFSTDENGVGHFYGHPRVSCDIARAVMKRLRYDNETIHRVCTLVLHHYDSIEPTQRRVKRWLNRLGEDNMRLLLKVKYADMAAHSPRSVEKKEPILAEICRLTDEIIAENQCFKLKDLAVTGDDLIKLGMHPGPCLGEMLIYLLDKVIEEALPNEKQALIDEVQRKI